MSIEQVMAEIKEIESNFTELSNEKIRLETELRKMEKELKEQFGIAMNMKEIQRKIDYLKQEKQKYIEKIYIYKNKLEEMINGVRKA